MSRRWHRRAAALVLLPLFLLAGIAQASVLYRCRMDGEARTTCCCPAKQASEDLPTGPSLSRGSCCDTEIQARVEQAPAVQSADERQALAALVVPLHTPATVLPWPMPRRAAPVAQAPPSPSVPILLQKSSRLI